MKSLKKIKYLGFDLPYSKAEVVFFGVPFDGTSSYRAGSRFAPIFVREASESIETYSISLDKDIEEKKICDAGDILLTYGNTNISIKRIGSFVRKFIRDNKKIFAVGGEHLITLPIVKELYGKYNDLKIIYLDAHADLRDEYLGERYSHATVLRRICEFLPGENIYVWGVRSGEKEEISFGRENLNFYLVNEREKFIDEIKNIPQDTPIYISLDLDILDPSVIPGVGNPEPGGISFNSLVTVLYEFGSKNVVGMDIVELSPHYDSTGVSNIVCAKLIREMVLLFK